MTSSLTPYKRHTSDVQLLSTTDKREEKSGCGCGVFDKISQKFFSRHSRKPLLTSPITPVSGSSYSSTSTSSKNAPTSKVFNCLEFRYEIFSYLQFREVGVAKRVSHLWKGPDYTQDPLQNVLSYYHRNRKILSVLAEAPLLAKAFRAPDPKRVKPSYWAEIFAAEIFAAERNFPHLKTLDLCCAFKETVGFFNSPTVQMPQVETLNVSYVSIDEEEIVILLNKLPLLRTLVIVASWWLDPKLPATTIETKGRNWTSLNLNQCRSINTQSLRAIGKGCPQLRELDISRTSNIEEEGIQALSDGCPALTSLAMRHNTIASAAFSVMVFGQLTHLDLQSCRGVTQPELEAVRQGCPSLTSLNLGLNSLSETTFASLIFPALRALDLSLNLLLDKRGLEVISYWSPNLTTLKLSGCTKIDFGAFQAMVFSRLRILDISYCQDVHVKSIEALSQGCPEITSLSVTVQEPKSHVTFEAIARLLTHLRILRIVSSSIKKKGIQALGKSKTLVALDFGPGPKIDSQSIQTIPVACPQLTSLNISNNPNVTTDHLRAIAQGCRYLSHIDIFYCHKINLQSLRVLALARPLLKSITFHSFWIGKSPISLLREEFPHITFIDK